MFWSSGYSTTFMMSVLMFLVIFLSQVLVVLAGRPHMVPFARVCTIADGTGRSTQATSTFLFAQLGLHARSNLAVDNIFNSNFFDGSCYHSATGDPMPRWVVDLGSTKQIESVFILNMESNPERLRNVTVEIYNEDPIANPSAYVAVCGTIEGGIPASANVTVTCPFTLQKIILWYSKAIYPSGRYVSIRKDGEYLHFCEVVVNVVADKKLTNLHRVN